VRPDSSFIVVWEGKGDEDEAGIYARIVPADGVPVAEQFGIPGANSAEEEAAPDLAILDASNFVVVWHGWEADGNGYGIMARKLSDGGTPEGEPIQVNETIDSNQEEPAILTTADGYAVAWYSAVEDGGSHGIYVRRFDAAGTALAPQTHVNVHVSGAQKLPAMASQDDGKFVVAWQSYNQDGDEKYGVFFRSFGADGAALDAADSHLNRNFPDDQRALCVAGISDGGFIFVWESTGGDQTEVYVQRYRADGTRMYR